MLYSNALFPVVNAASPPLKVQAFSPLAGHKFSPETLSSFSISQAFSVDLDNAEVLFIRTKQVLRPVSEKNGRVGQRDHIADCKTLKATELRRRYAAEANSHKNMKSREVLRGAIVHPDFRDFRSFLSAVGPMPARGATLDRINNADPEYAPGKVRWADKRTQNSNKGDSLLFFDSVTGLSFTTSQLAGKQGVLADTIRHRRNRGWTDPEIIAGRRASDVCSRLNDNSKNTPSVSHGAVTGRRLSDQERQFLGEAERFRRHRADCGEEAIIADYETLIQELFDGDRSRFSPEQYERHFEKGWRTCRPHLDFDNPTLPESQRALIQRIDPDYVEAWNARRSTIVALSEQI